jgi:hypothetical protein
MKPSLHKAKFSPQAGQGLKLILWQLFNFKVAY